MELKTLNIPAADVKETILTLANFIENDGSQAATFATAKSKIYEYVRRGVGIKGRISDTQMGILRQYSETGITEETLNSKSRASVYVCHYLNAMLALQEHLLTVESDMNSGLPQVMSVDTVNGENQQMYSTVQQNRRKELNDLYFSGKKGKGKHSRKRSAGYMGGTHSSNKRSMGGTMTDEMELKAFHDGAKEPLPDSDEEELGIDGKPKHRFYNEELELKTKAI